VRKLYSNVRVLVRSAVMEFIESERGQLKLMYDDFVYVKQKNLLKGVVSYECENRKRAKCKARIKICGNEIVSYARNHNHPPDKCRVEILQIKREIKNKAIYTQETAKQIITEAVHTVSLDALGHLPPLNHMSRTIRRYKKQAREKQMSPKGTKTPASAPEANVSAGDGNVLCSKPLCDKQSNKQWTPHYPVRRKPGFWLVRSNIFTGITVNSNLLFQARATICLQFCWNLICISVRSPFSVNKVVRANTWQWLSSRRNSRQKNKLCSS